MMRKAPSEPAEVMRDARQHHRAPRPAIGARRPPADPRSREAGWNAPPGGGAPGELGRGLEGVAVAGQALGRDDDVPARAAGDPADPDWLLAGALQRGQRRLLLRL